MNATEQADPVLRRVGQAAGPGGHPGRPRLWPTGPGVAAPCEGLRAFRAHRSGGSTTGTGAGSLAADHERPALLGRVPARATLGHSAVAHAVGVSVCRVSDCLAIRASAWRNG